MTSSDTSDATSSGSGNRSPALQGDDGQSQWSEWVICWCVDCRGRCRQEYRICLEHETFRGRDPDAPMGSSGQQAASPDDEEVSSPEHRRNHSDTSSDDSHARTRHQRYVQRMQRDIPTADPTSETAIGIERETAGDLPLPPHLAHHLRTYDRNVFGTWPDGVDLPRQGVPFQYWGRSYMIAPSSVHGAGIGLFSVDGIRVPRNCNVTLMVFGGPQYTWGQWHVLTQYIFSMATYGACINDASIQQRQRRGEQVSYGERLYVDGRPYSQGNIVGLINSSRGDDAETNCVFEERTDVEEDYMSQQVDLCVMVLATRTIRPRAELFINYSFIRRRPSRLREQ